MGAHEIPYQPRPVLMLWACVVAERSGHSRDLSLTPEKALAGYGAYAKAKSLGIAQPDGGAREA